MSRAVLTVALSVAVFVAAFNGGIARAATIQVLPIFGQAYGVDGKNVVGRVSTAHTGFLYDGQSFTTITYPGGTETTPLDISGGKIVGTYNDALGVIRGFMYDGSTYTTLEPAGAKRSVLYGISGDKILGGYVDASDNGHWFVYEGDTWTILDGLLPPNAIPRGIDGNNIVGTYTTALPLSRTRGFLFDGTTWTTLNDTFLTPTLIGDGTTAYDISGDNIVGVVRGGSFSAPFIYDGSTFTHPAVGLSGTVFTGISSNTIVGYYQDGPTGLDRPFIYTVPEPASLTLGAMGGLIFLAIARRTRRRQGRNHKLGG